MRIFNPLFLLVCNVFSVSYSYGDSKSASFDVSANVMTACQAGSGASLAGDVDFGVLDFGNQYFLLKAITVVGQANQGAIHIKCANGISYKILIDGGQSGNAANRYLTNNNGAQVIYNLYKDEAFNNIWDDQTGLTGTGNGQDLWILVYGVIPKQTTSSAGIYTDTVKVTISW